MDYKYKIGDAVLVRSDLESGEEYRMRSGPEPEGVNTFVFEMDPYIGQVVQISGYHGYQYEIQEDNGNKLWTDEMFEGLATCADFRSLL